MNGWLIYSENSAVKNKACIKLYMREAEKSKIKLELKTDYSSLPEAAPPDFAIMRTYNYRLSRELENKGIRVFNNSFVSEICNDKEKTYNYLKSNSIPVMETHIYAPGIVSPLKYPFVVKPADGHGGAGVFLVNNDSELEAALSENSSRKILFQKKASRTGKDLRVYVIGNEIICGMMRESDTDFRSNFSLGGKAYIHYPNNEEEILVHKVTELFKFDYAGIDIIYDEERPVINEIEDVAGARMLYANTDIDIIELFMKYINTEMYSE